MTEDTRQLLITTPVREMGEALICAYSNSAHGVPRDLDDLRALLPRYAELMAQDVQIDDMGVGTGLTRFGDARRLRDGFLSDAQQQALNHWARLMVLHFGWAEAKEQDNLECPVSLIETLISGPIPAEVVLAAIDELCAVPEVGAAAFGQLMAVFNHRPLRKKGQVGLNLFALGYATAADRERVTAWMNAPDMPDRIIAAAGQQTSEAHELSLGAALVVHGQWDAALMQNHRPEP